jgi:DNA-binding transcriptional regulator YdaS (Cro superfamily)
LRVSEIERKISGESNREQKTRRVSWRKNRREKGSGSNVSEMNKPDSEGKVKKTPGRRI